MANQIGKSGESSLSLSHIIASQQETIDELQLRVDHAKEYKDVVKVRLKEAAQKLRTYRLRVEELLRENEDLQSKMNALSSRSVELEEERKKRLNVSKHVATQTVMEYKHVMCETDRTKCLESGCQTEMAGELDGRLKLMAVEIDNRLKDMAGNDEIRLEGMLGEGSGKKRKRIEEERLEDCELEKVVGSAWDTQGMSFLEEIEKDLESISSEECEEEDVEMKGREEKGMPVAFDAKKVEMKASDVNGSSLRDDSKGKDWAERVLSTENTLKKKNDLFDAISAEIDAELDDVSDDSEDQKSVVEECQLSFTDSASTADMLSSKVEDEEILKEESIRPDATNITAAPMPEELYKQENDRHTIVETTESPDHHTLFSDRAPLAPEDPISAIHAIQKTSLTKLKSEKRELYEFKRSIESRLIKFRARNSFEIFDIFKVLELHATRSPTSNNLPRNLCPRTLKLCNTLAVLCRKYELRLGFVTQAMCRYFRVHRNGLEGSLQAAILRAKLCAQVLIQMLLSSDANQNEMEHMGSEQLLYHILKFLQEKLFENSERRDSSHKSHAKRNLEDKTQQFRVQLAILYTVLAGRSFTVQCARVLLIDILTMEATLSGLIMLRAMLATKPDLLTLKADANNEYHGRPLIVATILHIIPVIADASCRNQEELGQETAVTILSALEDLLQIASWNITVNETYHDSFAEHLWQLMINDRNDLEPSNTFDICIALKLFAATANEQVIQELFPIRRFELKWNRTDCDSFRRNLILYVGSLADGVQHQSTATKHYAVQALAWLDGLLSIKTTSKLVQRECVAVAVSIAHRRTSTVSDDIESLVHWVSSQTKEELAHLSTACLRRIDDVLALP